MGDNIWITLIGILSGVNVAFIAAMLYRMGTKERELQEDITMLHREMSDFRLHVAEEYQRAGPMLGFMRDVLHKLDVIQKELSQKADRP